MWVPGLCTYTGTVCRSGGEKGEKEMKALVTAAHFNLTTIDAPCTNPLVPPTITNCPIVQPNAQAPGIGINATMHQVAIPGLVDGPTLENDMDLKKEISDGKYMIDAATQAAILLSCIGVICSFAPAVKLLIEARQSTSSTKEDSHLPSILSSNAESNKQKGESV